MEQQKDQLRQQELETLEQIIIQGCNEDDANTELVKKLCVKHPYHYVSLMKKHGRTGGHPSQHGFLAQAFVAAFYLTNQAWWEVQRFLVTPPQTEAEHKQFDRAVVILTPMLEAQNSNN